MYRNEPTMMMAVLLVVGLAIGGGVGYFLAPRQDYDSGTPTGTSWYNSGYEAGFEDGVASRPSSFSSSNQEIMDALDGVTNVAYGAIVAGLVAALASIVCLMQLSRYPPR